MSIPALRSAVTLVGGTPTQYTYVGLLREWITAKGGTPAYWSINLLLRQAITTVGGTPTKYDQTSLLRELIGALGQTPISYIRKNLWEQLAGISGGSASPLALGVNLGVPDWWLYATIFKDTAYSAPGNVANESGGFTGSTTGNTIPDANRDANGVVKSVPGGEAAISLACQFPTTLAQRRLTWTSKLGGANHGCATITNRQGGTGVTVDLTGQSVTYTPSAIADGSSTTVPVFDFTPVSSTDYPINFIDRPVTDDGAVLTSEFSSLVTAACSTAPVIRWMDGSSVNRHNSPIHETATAGKTISSITFVGTLATVTTSTAHGLLGIGTASQSASVTVSGATPATYNVTDAFVKVISPTQFQYTMGGTPTGNATVMGSYTVGDVGYQSTNLHYPSVGTEPGTQFLEPIYTSANRNKNKADAEWHDGVMLESRTAMCAALGAHFFYNAPPNADSTFYADAASVCAAFSTTNSRDTLVEVGNEHWNPGFPWFHQLRNEANLRGTQAGAKTQCRLIDTVGVTLSGAQTVDGFAVVTGDRILRAVGNSAANGVYIANTAGAWTRATDADATGEIVYRDIWAVTTGLTNANTSWFVSTTGTITVGTTAFTIAQIGNHHRYAEKVVEVANAFISAFASIPTRLKVIAAYQNYGSPTVWDDMASFVGPTDWAKITHLAVAPYYGDNTQMGIAVSYVGSTATLKAAISADIDATITQLVGHVSKAVSLGKTLITYEGGSTVNLSDNTYRNAWARSADAYDLELRFLQQLELRAAPLQTGGLAMLQYSLAYPLGTNNFSWGLAENVTQAHSKATTPKLQAHTDFLAGTRVLSAATGSIANADPAAAVGTSLGTLTGSAYGVVWSLTDSDGGRLAINAATGEVTIAAGLAGTANGARSVTVRQTLGALTNDTTVAYNVAAAGSTFDAAHTDASITLSGGNLTATKNGVGGDAMARGTLAKSAAYCEILMSSVTGSTVSVGLTGGAQPTNDALGLAADSVGWLSDGRVFQNSIQVATWSTWTSGDRLSIAWKSGNFYGRKNAGAWEGSADPSAGTGGIAVTTTNAYAAVNLAVAAAAGTANFGSTAFSQSVPTGVTNWN